MRPVPGSCFGDNVPHRHVVSNFCDSRFRHYSCSQKQKCLCLLVQKFVEQHVCALL